MFPAGYGSMSVEGQPTVSTRRRLQNRVAQRKYRERRAGKEKATKKSTADDAMTAYEEYLPDQYSNGSFADGLDEFFFDNYSEIDALLIPPIEKTKADVEKQPNASNQWNTYTSALQESSHLSIPPPSPSEPVGVQRAMARPGNTSLTLGREVIGIQPSETSSRSNVSNSSNGSLTPSPLSVSSPLSISSPWTASSTSTGNETGKPLSPLLHVATRNCNRAVMQVLLRRGAAAIDERDSEGRTALHVAAGLGDKMLVSFLLGEGADPQVADVQGQRALYYAVEHGQVEVVEMLLDANRITE